MSNLIKVTNKDIIWNYLGYGITFGINVILLPLVLHFLTPKELGLWYVFSSIGALITLFDFGFAPQVARNITYAFSGANDINKTGVDSLFTENKPNYKLLGNIISASKLLYFLIATISLILLLTVGTLYIKYISKDFFNNKILLSWLIFCFGCFVNLNYSYYNAVFRGLGNFIPLNKSLVISRSIQFVFSFLLLNLGFGILAVSIGYIVNTIVFRYYLTYYNKKINELDVIFKTKSTNVKLIEKLNLLKVIWHNAWRDGLVTISNYIVTQSNTILCSLYFGLNITASYALSVQIVTFIASASTIIFGTIQPVLAEASLTNNIVIKKQYFSMSWFFFASSYIILILIFVLCGIPLLELIKSNTKIDINVFIFYSVYMFLTTNFTLSASYISTSNRLPYASSFIISAILSVLIAVIFAKYTSLNVWGLILAHIIVQFCYNIWKWPTFVMKELKTNPWNMIIDTRSFIKLKYFTKN